MSKKFIDFDPMALMFFFHIKHPVEINQSQKVKEVKQLETKNSSYYLFVAAVFIKGPAHLPVK